MTPVYHKAIPVPSYGKLQVKGAQTHSETNSKFNPSYTLAYLCQLSHLLVLCQVDLF